MKTSYGGYEAGPIPPARPHEMVFHDPFARESVASPTYHKNVQPSRTLAARDRGSSSSHDKRLQRKKALEGVSRDLLALALQRRLAD